MLRLPRPVRVTLGAWVLGVMLAPVLIGLGALILLPFGAPRSINAGPAWEFWNRVFLPASFVAGIPLFILVLLEEWPGRMTRLSGYAPPLAKISLLMAVLWLWSGISVALLRDSAAPVIANAILRPPVEAWSMAITHAERGRRNSKECPNRLSFEIPAIAGHELSVCVGRNSPLFRAGAGDILHLKGRSGPFGITYLRDDLRLELAGEANR